MKVLLLSKYDQAGASTRYRTFQYLDYLREKGVQVTVNSLLDSHHIKKIFSKQKPSYFYYIKQFIKRLFLLAFAKEKYDICWIEGELFPYLPFFIEKFFLPKFYIADYDDAIFHNYNMHRLKIVRKLLGKKIDNVMRYSKHVIAGNEYIKQYALAAGAKKVSILPTVVDANVYKPVLSEAQVDKIIIGWVGSPSTVKYLDVIKPALVSVAKKTNVKLYVIGGEFTIDGIDTMCHSWPEKWSETEEIELLNQIHIGIMPLVDSFWERGKCGFKLIKYMACGKPVIASPVSSNLEVIVHGVHGYLADTLKDWEDYLLKLISNKHQCAQFGQDGRGRMLEKYSLQAIAPFLHKIFMDEVALKSQAQ